jgi:hypothetical protein
MRYYSIILFLFIFIGCSNKDEQKEDSLIYEFQSILILDSLELKVTPRPRFSGAGALSLNDFEKNNSAFTVKIKDSLDLTNIVNNIRNNTGVLCNTDTIKELGMLSIFYYSGNSFYVGLSVNQTLVTKKAVYSTPLNYYDIIMDYLPVKLRDSWRK